MEPIIITRIAGAFQAKQKGISAIGVGNTWMEAVGSLVAMDPAMFGVSGIQYGRDESTRNYTIERSLDQEIV